MRTLGRVVSGMLALGLTTTSVPVVAQQAGACACRVPVSQATGQIKSATGEVLLTQSDGFINARAGSALAIGDQIKSGPVSSSTIAFGEDCEITITENADVWVQSFGTTACLWVEYQQKPVSISSQQSQTDTTDEDDDDDLNIGLLLAGIAGFGGLLALALGSGDSPASP